MNNINVKKETNIEKANDVKQKKPKRDWKNNLSEFF